MRLMGSRKLLGLSSAWPETAEIYLSRSGHLGFVGCTLLNQLAELLPVAVAAQGGYTSPRTFWADTADDALRTEAEAVHFEAKINGAPKM